MLNEIKISLDEGAYEPVRTYGWDAGFDLRTPEDFMMLGDDTKIVHTGVHVDIPKGYAGLIMGRSGLNVRHGITCEGVIDAGYTGEIVVKLYRSKSKKSLNSVYGICKTFEAGDRIAQLVIVPVETPKIVIVDSIEGGERGNNGFGSTGN